MRVRSLFVTLMLCVTLLISACQTVNDAPQPGLPQTYNQSAEQYLKQSQSMATPKKQSTQLKAAGRYLQDKNTMAAIQVLSNIDTQNLPTELSAEKTLLEAYLSTLDNNPNQSLNLLKTMPNKTLLKPNQQIAYYQISSIAYQQTGDTLASAKTLIQLDNILPEKQKTENEQQIWLELNQLPLANLQNAQRYTLEGVTTGWLELAYLANAYKNNPQDLQSQLTTWLANYPHHPADQFAAQLQKNIPLPQNTLNTKQANFALLLPLNGQLSQSSQAIRNGFMAAYYTQEQQHPSEQSIQVYNTSKQSTKNLYITAVQNGATTVVGPLTKSQVAQLNHIDIKKPTLALNFTPHGSDDKSLFQFALSPQDEAVQVAEKTWYDGKSHVLIIAPDSSWGQDIAKTFTNTWQKLGGNIVDTLMYTKQTRFDQSIKRILKVNDAAINAKNNPDIKQTVNIPIHRQDIDAIFLIASPTKAREIIPMLKYYYANDIPVYATSYVYSGTPNPARDKDLDGVRFCDIPLVLDDSKKMQQIRKNMQTSINPAEAEQVRLYAFGMDAYQLIMHYNQLMTGSFSLQGMTGTLYLGKHQQILRDLQWAQFKNGYPVKIAGIKNT
ncbi:MAG: hypothetical protein CMF49_06225 [Legionellales bacterium]|nr:hypothetical protein [Legionellales bacterium]